MEKKNVFIIGSNGIPANYGGFETFVENLTAKRIDSNIKYHVACIGNDNSEFEYNNARCFNVKLPNIGPAKAEYYDLAALERTIKYIKKNDIKDAVVYVLGTGVGLFIWIYKKRLNKLGARLIVNPDGCEWKRKKWNYVIRKFFKICEGKMTKHAELLICDAVNMEKYMQEEYKKYNPNTTFIAYGADVPKENNTVNEKLQNWYKENEVKLNEYYLIVGRFVPENNYETMIREFVNSSTKKDLVIITNVAKNKFYEELKEKTKFEEDKRVKFVGTVYDKELLTSIRQNAFAYIHGHEVGGTNPSLLEALSTTKLNLLYEVGFNKEVAKESALYWSKEEGNLKELIAEAEIIPLEKIEDYGVKAKQRIIDDYSWKKIVSDYEKIFLSEV